jgi:hypothetical protein
VSICIAALLTIRYFGDEEDVVDDEVAPQEAGSQFQFGGQFPGQAQQGVFNFGGN